MLKAYLIIYKPIIHIKFNNGNTFFVADFLFANSLHLSVANIFNAVTPIFTAKITVHHFLQIYLTMIPETV